MRTLSAGRTVAALCFMKGHSGFPAGKARHSPGFSPPRIEKGVYSKMAEEKKVILTREGYQKLEQELNYYISVRRNEISEQIAIARGFGDLSENAEYDEAKNEQSRIEAKIVEMENTLRNCIVVENDEVNTDVVGVGNTVKVKNLTMKIDQVITIVGANETDPKNMKISSESPIGAALLGKKKGETVEVDVPAGLMKLKVVEISR